MADFLLFFDISTGELLLILIVVFLVFGPKKLPEMARKVGRGLNELRRATDEIKNEIRKETLDIENTFDDKKEPVNKSQNIDNTEKKTENKQ